MKTFQEAIETGETDLIHPVLRKELESGKEEILPFLPEKAQDYYEMIISDNYHKILERIEYYTGIKPSEETVPQLCSIAMNSLREIAQIEKSKKSFLEKMAVDLVLGLVEFTDIKKAVEEKQILIDAKLGPADLENAVSQVDAEKEKNKKPKTDGNLSSLEEIDMELAEEFKSNQEDRLKRRMCNVLTQGEAVSKMYIFNFVKKELDEIDKKLFNKYGMVCSVAELGYFIMDPRRSLIQLKMSAQGSEEVISKDDKHIIKARASVFPYLIQEIIKGILDYLRADPNKNVPIEKVKKTLEGDYIEQEIKDTISGPELAKHISKMIDTLDLKYFPYIVQEVDKLPVSDFKIFFKKDDTGNPSKEAQDMMRIIVKRAKKIREDAGIE